MSITYPYSDEYMVFDEKTNRYVLTAKYILDAYGIDLQSIVNDRNAINERINKAKRRRTTCAFFVLCG